METLDDRSLRAGALRKQHDSGAGSDKPLDFGTDSGQISNVTPIDENRIHTPTDESEDRPTRNLFLGNKHCIQFTCKH
jgi:hypothetical protein